MLDPLTVNATRFEATIDSIPAAVSRVDQASIQNGTQQFGLDESLQMIPGVFIQNQYNFAQDNRISIRGFGARADFGIRGIRLFVDGIPATTPDGQGEVDGLSLASAQSIEVLRGPSSALYGAASGGVILIKTEDGTQIPFVETRWTVGAYGLVDAQFKTGGQQGNLNYLFSGSRLTYDGYRENSRTENYKFNGKLRYDLDKTSSLTTVINIIDFPIQDDPGALNQAAAEANPRQAYLGNLTFDSGETVKQEKVGLTYEKSFSEAHSIQARTYYVHRDFANKLPFKDGGQVSFERNFFGGGLQYNFRADRTRIRTGLDYDNQDDERKNYDNNNGVRGPLVLDQDEKVTNLGLFTAIDYDLLDNLTLSAALRYDQVDFDVSDHLISDGDDSGKHAFEELSPMVGLSWALTKQLALFTNVSTSFETPTTTEFDNPNGGGFNPDLDAQNATNYEIGAKGRTHLGSMPLRYELTLFHIDIENALVPYELPAFPDREFFRNAGSSQREGLEVATSIELLPVLTASIAYTWSDFSYESFISPNGDFSGNQTPGVPKHYGSFELDYRHPSGAFIRWTTRFIDSFYANDSNSTEIDDYIVSDLRMGLEHKFGNWTIAPYMGIYNLFDESYYANIRLNPFGGRFYEPAPERNLYGGIRVNYSFR